MKLSQKLKKICTSKKIGRASNSKQLLASFFSTKGAAKFRILMEVSTQETRRRTTTTTPPLLLLQLETSQIQPALLSPAYLFFARLMESLRVRQVFKKASLVKRMDIFRPSIYTLAACLKNKLDRRRISCNVCHSQIGTYPLKHLIRSVNFSFRRSSVNNSSCRCQLEMNILITIIKRLFHLDALALQS